MTFHTHDGAAFLGLRERSGELQIVYDHTSGRRVVFRLEGAVSQIDAIQRVLGEAACSKDALVALASALTTHRISFHVA
jgi:hypothetical protein